MQPNSSPTLRDGRRSGCPRPPAVSTALGAFAAGLLLVAGALGAGAQTTTTHSFSALDAVVPDGDPAGMSDTRSVVSPVVGISAVRVRLRVAGEFNGDLYGYLRHITPQATNYVVLLNRPGRTAASAVGYDDAGLDVTLADDAEHDIHAYRNSTNVPAGQPLTGTWQPDGRTEDPGAVLDTSPRATSLARFQDMDANGEWTLFLADMESGGTNMLVSWELELTGAITPVVTWDTPASIVYGTALGAGQLNASSPVPGSFAYSPPAGTVLDAGEHILTAVFTPDDLASYVPVTSTVTVLVHRAPVAGADTIERYPTNCVKVSLASLLANDSDPDGDPIAFVSVAETSEHGATLVRSGNWIYYTPPPGFAAADSFAYEISDGRGATATGTVTVTIKADFDPAMNLTITDLGNRSLRLRFDGVPFRDYTIHYTDSMSPPDWQPLTNITASCFGIFECTNTVPEDVPQRFYRSSCP